MKKLILILIFFGFYFGSNAQNTAVLWPDSAKTIINKNIYGHFAEHLGACIYGGFYVGENNTKIPNKNGVRLDIVDALKKLKIPNLRWPGGCFADTYHWKDGIGPKPKRPSMVNTWWGGVTEDNAFGTHDFLNMCELIGTEPYISGNVGSGTVQELKDWTQYVNLAEGTSPMSNERQQNGRQKPWDVSIWGIGNEAWGCGGNMSPEYYVNIYRQYTTFMSAGKKGLFRVASGANSDNYNWTETLMKGIPGYMMEGLAMHHYSVINWGDGKKSDAVDFTENEYAKTMKEALKMEELIVKHSAIMDKYDTKKKVALVVDEWGGWYNVEKGTNGGFLYQQNTIRDAMIAGTTLNTFNNHADRVRMANLAQIVNVLQAVILTKEEKMILTPTYHVMEMYNVHQDAKLIPLTIKSKEVILDGKAFQSISASASKNANGLTHITLTNIDPNNSQEINLETKGIKFKTIKGRILTSELLTDHNTFENPNKVQPKIFDGTTVSEHILKVKLPAHSVVVLELE